MALRSVTQPVKAGLPPQVKEHFLATVRLSRELTEPGRLPVEALVLPDERLDIRADEIYRLFFHGPAFQVVDAARVDGGRVVARMAAGLPPAILPSDAETVMAPRLVELCFQAAALWSLKACGAMAFPAGLEVVSVYRQEPAVGTGRIWCALETPDGERFDGQVFDDAGNVYVELKGYQTVARPG